MEYSLAKVALNDINLEDRSFRITTTRDKTSLLESIDAVGLLVPPALQRGDSGWTTLSGFRRLRACQQTGRKKVAARLVTDDLSPLDGLRLAVIENNSQRPLNLIETARAVSRLRGLCGSDQTFSRELARLGLPTSRRMIARLERLMHLGEALQAAILDGVIGINVALSIGEMRPQDQIAVHALLTRIPMSVSKQKEILILTQEIAARDRKSVHAVLHMNRIKGIVEDQETDRNLKSSRIRRQLRQMRYPNLTRAESRYQEAVRMLKLGPHMRIAPPEGFEGLTYTLSLRFQSRRDLERAHQKLSAVIQNPVINGLFPE